MNHNDNNLFDEEEAENLDYTWIFDDKANAAAALAEKLADAHTPGFLQAEFNPEEAELVGAFVEDALSEQDAIDSNLALIDVIETMASANTVETPKVDQGD